MFTSIRRAVAIAAVFFLLSTQSYAVGLGDVFNGTTASTDFGTWSSPRTGSKYFYGGSYTFAFKGAGKYQPFFQGQAPSFRMGCNGFSLSGGFVALLGLDEIKTLLKNSGATLAWGLMLGLQITMPSIAAVFNNLRQFAREIQNLLRNACHAGQALMMNTKAGQKLSGAIHGITNKFTGKVNDWFSNVNKGIAGWTNTLHTANDKIEKGCLGLSGAAQKRCMNETSVNEADRVIKLSTTNAVTVTSLVIGSHAINTGSPKNGIGIAKLSDFFSDGKIGDTTIYSSSSDELTKAKTTILIDRLFFGDLATPSDSFMQIMKISKMSGVVHSGQFAIDGNTSTDDILAKQTLQLKEMSQGMSIIAPIIASPKEAAKALIDGITASTADGVCHDGYCIVPDQYIYLIDMAFDPDAKQKIQLLGNVNIASGGTISVNWNGAYLESLKAIRGLVKKQTGYNNTYKTVGESTAASKDPSTTAISIPLLLPNIDRYLKSIVSLEKRAKKETPYTAQLKTILAKYNGYFFAQSLSDALESNIIDALGKRGDPPGSPNYNRFQGFLKQIQDKRDAINAQIKDEMKNQMTYRDLSELFEKVDIQIRQNLVKDY